MSWWQMGGNAAYVWSSVGLTLFVVVINFVWARRGLREAEQAARRRAAANAKDSA